MAAIDPPLITMTDRFGRNIDYLRISVTDRCNLRCKYCMPEDGVADIGHENIIGFEAIERVVRVAVDLGFRKFRITGGEPLVRRGIVGLVERIASVRGVETLAMTSNGILLSRMAAELAGAGLDRVNISLDTLQAERYRDITRGGELADVLAGIHAAETAGLFPIRVNVVAVRGFNDDEVLDFARLTRLYPWDVRFIELMPVGDAAGLERGYISVDELRAELRGFEPVSPDGVKAVARYYRYPGAPGRIGLISPLSSHFCGDCNKLRLTADGRLKTCLHSNREIDIKPALRSPDDAALRALISEAVLAKEERHLINDGEAPVRRGMNKIGG
jgi:cyclic pyranopterin phosphate synthase